MLTGFNTDIKYAERVFHVQTEDRGLANPFIESLVYVGGEILLSKKSPYVQHVQGEKVDEKAVRELMDFQHRRIIEAIRRGRFDEKKPGEAVVDLGEDTFPTPPGVSLAAVAAVAAILSAPSEPLPGDAPPRTSSPKAPEKPAAPAKAPEKPATEARKPGTPRSAEQRVPIAAAAPESEFVETEVTPNPAPATPAHAPAARPVSGPQPQSPAASTAARRVPSAARPAAPPQPAAPLPSAVAPAVRPKTPASAPAAAAAPGTAPRKTPGYTSGPKTLDQVIVEYLASEAASERLDLSIMAGGDFLSGETVALTVIASTSLSRKPVAGAQVTIRVVSTSGPPQVLFRGVTGNDGMVKTSCSVPDIGNGSAALIVVGFSSMGSSEVKYLIRKRAN